MANITEINNLANVNDNFDLKNEIKLESVMEFHQRLDYYWQSNMIYAVILLVYTSIRGLMSEDFVYFLKHDPIILLFLIIISLSLLNMFFTRFKSNSIIVADDYLIIKNRFRENRYSLNDIDDIRFYKEKIFRTREILGYFKIKVKSRKRIIRLRATSYWNDKALHKKMIMLKHKLKGY